MIEVQLEHFEETELDKELNKTFGKQNSQCILYNDVYHTFYKYMIKHATRDIVILTDKLPTHIYKVTMYEINIKNTCIPEVFGEVDFGYNTNKSLIKKIKDIWYKILINRIKHQILKGLNNN